MNNPLTQIREALEANHCETYPEGCKSCGDIICGARMAHEALQSLADFEKTHVNVMPSCVGCATAEAVIESEKVTVDAAKCDSVQMFVDKLNQVRQEKDEFVRVRKDRLKREYHINVEERGVTGTRESFQRWLDYLTGSEE